MDHWNLICTGHQSEVHKEMNIIMIVLTIISWLIGLVIMNRLIRSDRSVADKALGSVLLLTPILGPLLYLFFVSPPPANNPQLQARGPRGEYTNKWLVIGPVLSNALKRTKNRRAGTDGDG